MYKATIVIPNINGKGWLKDSIESVYAQTEQNFQLIVVDNGSTDESLEQARSYCSRANFTLIENGTNTGFSHAVNQGIAMAESEYVVLFNNDAFAEPQWLAELIRTAETDPKIFAVQSLMIRHFDRELADDAGDYVTWMGFACKTGDGRRVSRYTKQKRIFSACGGAALYRKRILDEIGTFDENFFAYFEDVDLSWRANNAGYKNVLCTTSAEPAPVPCGTTPSRASRAAATAFCCPSRTSRCSCWCSTSSRWPRATCSSAISSTSRALARRGTRACTRPLPC